mmetsp:Transcript_32166/g.94809  ORF Transcript_32166/g.94809 Transcript_32166/m.94809 type:complete len:284 (-) Transcript_32166:663-1514(-)
MSAGAAAGSPAFAALRRRRRAMPTATAASAAATTPAAAAGCARLGVAVAAAASLSDASDATLAAASLSICLAACCSAYFAATNEAAEAEASPTVAFSENWMEANLSAVALEDAWYACPSFWKSKLGSVKKRKPVSSPCAGRGADVEAPTRRGRVARTCRGRVTLRVVDVSWARRGCVGGMSCGTPARRTPRPSRRPSAQTASSQPSPPAPQRRAPQTRRLLRCASCLWWRRGQPRRWSPRRPRSPCPPRRCRRPSPRQSRRQRPPCHRTTLQPWRALQSPPCP